MPNIYWLDDAELPRDVAGGKGAGLSRLAAAGFPVPAGFVIPPAAVRQLTEGGASDVLEEIVSAWATLAPGGQEVAVRSSAIAEDGEQASFAGQHETILRVADHAALLDAIAACGESASNETSRRYREDRGIDEAQAQMAVVVQLMVEAEWAGVAFSIDPVSGDRDTVVVEAVPGTGETLVSGEVAGQRWVFGRPGFDLCESPVETDAPADMARTVAEAAVACEELFGSPQDIEFAWADDTAWMLQSRAITAAGENAGWTSEFDTPTDDATEWTNANIQEVLPGLLTPLSMSIYRESSRVGYNVGFQKLKLLAKDEWPPFMGTFYNRAYLNLTVTRLIAERTIGGNGNTIEQQYLAGDGNGATANREPFLKRAKFKAMSALPLVKMTLTIRSAADRIERQTRELERELHAIDPATLSNQELVEHLNRVLAFGAESFAVHLQTSGVALLGFDSVTKMVRPILGDETEGRAPALFSGMRGVESARIGLDLWDLVLVARSTGLDTAILGGDFDPSSPELPDGWRASWRAFLARHGHRGLNEMEASARCWRVDPTPVVKMLASYLRLSEEHSPPATLKRQETERRRLTRDLASRMNPVKRRIFRKVLSDGQGWVALREQTKSSIVRAARIPDHFLPEIQVRLRTAGTIENDGDIFFLAKDEIESALRGSGSLEDYRDAVRRRRRELERNRYVALPERFFGRPAPIEPDLPQHDGAVLRGTPVSPGIVTGRARVIEDPATDGPLEPGEILVAPVTDAGWTPLFALASGLVVNLGSALSHGSTVAREYGLPAVVNVSNATKVIRTGELVTVNGSAGTVAIIDEEG